MYIITCKYVPKKKKIACKMQKRGNLRIGLEPGDKSHLDEFTGDSRFVLPHYPSTYMLGLSFNFRRVK